MAAITEVGAWQAAWSALSADPAGSWLRARREEAFDSFLAAGFPTTRMEEWKHTSVAAIARESFAGSSVVASPADIARRCGIDAVAGPRLVFVNARLVPELSRAGSGGVRIEPLSAALAETPTEALAHLTRLAPTDGRAFVSLNTALWTDGAFVHIPRGVVLAEPIHVVSIVAGSGAVAAHARVLIVLDDHAQATVVETHAGEGEGSLSNVVTEIVLGAGASLDHAHVQRVPLTGFHVASTVARLGRDASLVSRVASVGARLSRHDLAIELAGEGATCSLDGLSFLAGSQHADHHTFVDHAVPHGTSNQLYKGVYGGRSRGVFKGKVLVRDGAQKTDAHQKNYNLLLSQEALVDTMPQLEIHADDVRCTHGATIGRLDDAALFYLRARGVGQADAMAMLTSAFAAEIVDRVKLAPLHDELGRLLAAKHLEVTGGVA